MEDYLAPCRKYYTYTKKWLKPAKKKINALN